MEEFFTIHEKFQLSRHANFYQKSFVKVLNNKSSCKKYNKRKKHLTSFKLYKLMFLKNLDNLYKSAGFNFKEKQQLD